MNWFYVLNAVSGVLLVALGAIAAFRPGKKIFSGLPLFLMAWGAQLALTNLASTTTQDSTAYLLFWLVELFLPLQAMLLLYHASEANQAGSAKRWIHKTCRVLAIAAAVLGLTGMLAAATWTSSILTVDPVEGGHKVTAGPWALAFFDAPQFIGVAFALVLLSFVKSSQQTWKDRAILVGLCVGWASSLARPLARQVMNTTSVPLLIILAVAATCVVLIVPARLLWSARHEPSKAVLAAVGGAAAIVGAGLLAWVGPHANGMWSTLLGPGMFRLLSLALLVPALWPNHISMTLQQKDAPTKVLPLGVCTLAVAIATAIIPTDSTNLIDSVWHTYAGGLAMASLAIIGSIGAFQLRELVGSPVEAHS